MWYNLWGCVFNLEAKTQMTRLEKLRDYSDNLFYQVRDLTKLVEEAHKIIADYAEYDYTQSDSTGIKYYHNQEAKDWLHRFEEFNRE
jgi:hypothetical protein